MSRIQKPHSSRRPSRAARYSAAATLPSPRSNSLRSRVAKLKKELARKVKSFSKRSKCANPGDQQKRERPYVL